MPKIISASRRTDIPAFYSEWFMNRLREGFCVYPNPLYPSTVYRVSLLPEDVSGIVFWTRHAAPLMPSLEVLDKSGYAYYFQYTITGYPKSMEPRTPSLDVATKTFSELSEQIGSNRVIWRYDPIILNAELDFVWHRDNFRRIADRIAVSTQRLVISVVDPYARTQRRVGTSEDGVSYEPEAYLELLRFIVGEAKQRGLSVQSCAEELNIAGIVPGSCVDANLMHSISGRPAPPAVRLHKQREGCLCHESVDIGVNESCGFGCLYCYATKNHEKAMETLKRHRPEWTSITQDIKTKPPEFKSTQPTLF